MLALLGDKTIINIIRGSFTYDHCPDTTVEGLLLIGNYHLRR